MRRFKRGEGCFGAHVRTDNRERTPPLVRLKALCGPDDDGAPCITVLLHRPAREVGRRRAWLSPFWRSSGPSC